MTGQFYIDGKDAYREYGVFITDGGYDELLSFPSLKEPAGNDWPEEDGKEVDLHAPFLDVQDVTLKFAAHRAMRTGDFLALFSDEAYHTFDFRAIGRVYRLRLQAQAALALAARLETFSLKFVNDFPVSADYVYKAPSSAIVSQEGYQIDGRSLARYGVWVLDGSDVEIRKTPAVKTNLLRNISVRHGAEYDDGIVRFQTKEVQLKCLMRADTPSEFWRNYDALLFDLTRAGERMLYVQDAGCSYPCYYKGCNTVRFRPAGCIWFEFDLTLVFTLSDKLHQELTPEQ